MVPKEVETGDKKNPVKPNGAAADEEEFMLAVAEAGGDDYEDAEDEWIVYTSPHRSHGREEGALGSRRRHEGRRNDHGATTPRR